MTVTPSIDGTRLTTEVYAVHLAADVDAMVAASGDLEAQVPGCPGWRVRDLLSHVIGVYRHKIAALDADAEPPAPEPPGDWGDLAEGDDPREVLRSTYAVLRERLGSRDPDSPTWSWWPPEQTVAFWTRRMTQETAVHRWDAEGAAGTGWRIDPLVAADGIDEYLQHMMAGTDKGADVGGTVHLHCTDEGLAAGSGEWIVHEITDGGARFDRAHTKGDCAVRGPAHDLLLWLWRRPAMVEVIGDAGVADRFVHVAGLA